MGLLGMPGLQRGLAMTLLAVLVSCASSSRSGQPGMHEGAARLSVAPRPVILIPGLLGTRLEDRITRRVVWGGVKGFLGGGVAYDLALPVDPDEPDHLEPAGLVAEVAGLDVYAAILKTLRRAGGYQAGTEHPEMGAAYFVFDYDWRLSCAATAAALDRKIKEIQALYKDPGLKVDIVAHSMGGLVTLYYLLYGDRDVRDDPRPVPDFSGARNVGTVVLLGTPTLGSVGALRACIEGRTLGLTSIPPEVFATGPSMYELLPSPSSRVLYGPDGQHETADIYDEATWRRLKWGIYNPRLVAGIRSHYIQRHPGVAASEVDCHMGRLYGTFSTLLRQAAGFHRAIEAASTPGGVRIVLIGGDCVPTLQALWIEQVGSCSVTRFSPGQVRQPPVGMDLRKIFYGPGDGQVTQASLLGDVPGCGALANGGQSLFPDARTLFVCTHHTGLVRNPSFQNDLIHALQPGPQTNSNGKGLVGKQEFK